MLLDFEILHICGMISLFGVFFIGSNALMRKRFGFSLSLVLSVFVSLLILSGIDGFNLSSSAVRTGIFLASNFNRGHLYTIIFGLGCLAVAEPLSKRISSQTYRSLFHMLLGVIFLLLLLCGATFALIVLVVLLVALSIAEYFRTRENNVLSEFLESILAPAFRGNETMGYLAGFFYLLGDFLVILLLPKQIAMASMAILAFADPSATLVGKKFGKTKWTTNRDKSIEGSAAMLVVSIAVLVLFHLLYGLELSFLTMILVAIAVTMMEALPLRVGDNILIPLLGAMIMAAGANAQSPDPGWLILLVILGLVVYYMRFLDLPATLISVFFGFLIFLASKPAFLVALLDFLVLGYIISRFRYDEKKKKNVAERRAGTRTINPVIANGIVPTFFSLVYGIDPRAAILLFTGALAGAVGDVFATEIGCLDDKFFKIFSTSRARVGDRGAISLMGELGCIIGPALTGLVLAFLFKDYRLVFFSLLSGFVGSNMDSVLNSFVPNITRSETNVLATLTSGIILLLFY